MDFWCVVNIDSQSVTLSISHMTLDKLLHLFGLVFHFIKMGIILQRVIK